jgi:hypothetical protein
MHHRRDGIITTPFASCRLFDGKSKNQTKRCAEVTAYLTCYRNEFYTVGGTGQSCVIYFEIIDDKTLWA